MKATEQEAPTDAYCQVHAAQMSACTLQPHISTPSCGSWVLHMLYICTGLLSRHEHAWKSERLPMKKPPCACGRMYS